MHGVTHMIGSALIHGAIYSVICRVMRNLTFPETIAAAGAIVLLGIVFLRLGKR